jgi:hypothetical protein
MAHGGAAWREVCQPGCNRLQPKRKEKFHHSQVTAKVYETVSLGSAVWLYTVRVGATTSRYNSYIYTGTGERRKIGFGTSDASGCPGILNTQSR